MDKLHCGACMESFESGDELLIHQKTCEAFDTLLPMAWRVYLGKDVVGHGIAALLVAIRKSIPLIKKYAWAIANDIDSIKRAEIHSELCEKLGLSRKDFQPFESSEIKEIPSVEQAESIIWNFLRGIPIQYSRTKAAG